MTIVHYVANAGQGDIQIVCTGKWTEPKWGPKQTAPVFKAETGDNYTFEKEDVNCKDCLDSPIFKERK